MVDVNGDTLAFVDAVRSADGLASRIDPDTPMIVLTGNAHAPHRVRMLERGRDDVVAKPFSYPELGHGSRLFCGEPSPAQSRS